MRCKDNSGPSGADAVVADLAGVIVRSGDRPVSALRSRSSRGSTLSAVVSCSLRCGLNSLGGWRFHSVTAATVYTWKSTDGARRSAQIPGKAM